MTQIEKIIKKFQEFADWIILHGKRIINAKWFGEEEEVYSVNNITLTIRKTSYTLDFRMKNGQNEYGQVAVWKDGMELMPFLSMIDTETFLNLEI